MSVFETEIRVAFYEVDPMDVVHHSNYIRYFEKARTEMLRSVGHSHAAMERKGIWIPVLSVDCQYKIPAVYDDQLIVRCWAENLKGASMDICYEIVRKGETELLVTGRTSHAFTDPNLKPIRLKKQFPDIYKQLATLEKS